MTEERLSGKEIGLDLSQPEKEIPSGLCLCLTVEPMLRILTHYTQMKLVS